MKGRTINSGDCRTITVDRKSTSLDEGPPGQERRQDNGRVQLVTRTASMKGRPLRDGDGVPDIMPAFLRCLDEGPPAQGWRLLIAWHMTCVQEPR